MEIGSKVKMNELSDYTGETGSIIKTSKSKDSFIIELNSGLVITAPKEVIDFNI